MVNLFDSTVLNELAEAAALNECTSLYWSFLAVLFPLLDVHAYATRNC